MTPTAEQIEKVCEQFYPAWAYMYEEARVKCRETVRSCIATWEHVCPRPKPVKMSDVLALIESYGSAHVNACDIVHALAKCGNLTIEDDRGDKDQ